MDSRGREESISTNGVARNSPESHQRWEPEMAIMANNGEFFFFFFFLSPKVL